jgi:3-dehydroquinate dehydratase-1
MNTIKVRDIEIGAGAPKIIVPIVGVTKDDIIAEAKTFDSIPVDMVEWRVDWFENVFEFDKVEEVLKELRDALGNIPILMTFRTSKEGGEKAIEPEAYAKLNIKAAQTGYVDFVDVEIFTGDEIVKKIIDGVHAAGARVIASNHDFFKTPAQSDIVYRLRKMQDMGADIPKIAVMPQNKRDVLTLLSATEEMVTDYADRPIITMSARCFSCTYIIILLVKQGFRTMPMRFSHISRFITSSRKYISETNQAVGNTVLIVHMAIARYSILLRECTCHQHSTMRTT